MTRVPRPGRHGGDGPAVARALGVDPAGVLDLSLSVNPVAPDAAEVVAKHLDALRRYPDASPATDALAGAIGVAPERVLLTNGGAEAIALVAAELGAGWVEEPDFSLYRRHLASLCPGAPRWKSNPHNPSGRLAPADERAHVWDEAFWPLATGTWTRGDGDASGSVVVGSLTKLLACPGLRAGYVLAPPGRTGEDLVDRLRRRQPEWALNGLAASSVPDLLERADLAEWAAAVADLRCDLVRVLQAHGYEPEPSDANFVLVPAPGLRAALAREGVVVRDCASFGLPAMVRVAVPDRAGLARLDAALSAAIRGHR